MKFPDKVLMGQSISSNLSGKAVPKLDFTKVNAKYKSTSMKVDMKDVQLKQNYKLSENNTLNKQPAVNDEGRIIKMENNRLKAEKKLYERNKDKLKEKIKKLKKLNQEIKEKYHKLSNTLKLAQNKIEVLESYIKKATSMPTTDDTVNKRNLNNTSMVFR